MSADLLSYLMAPAGASDVQIGAARDLVAARVLARKADEGHPHARAFVQNAQEVLAQARVRRLRADRLRAGAAKASAMGYHEMARLGAEAAGEETREAGALEANVVSAVHGAHASDGIGYYDAGEQRLLSRKAFEDNLSSAAREGVMSKLLAQLYQGSESSAMFGCEDESGELASTLHVAAESFGGDMDSVFGADAAERASAVLGATVRQLRKQAGLAVLPKAAVARRDARKALGLKVLPRKVLLKKIKAAKAAAVAMGYAEDARESVEVAESALLDRAVDYGADDAVAAMMAKLKTLPTKRVVAIANDPFRKPVVREAARAELSRREEEGDEDAVTPQAKRLRAMTEKFKTLPSARVLAIAKDPFRRKDVRLAARAELARRAKGGAKPEGGVESEIAEVEADGAPEAAVAPPAYTEESYLDSYKGLTPGRKRFVKFFRDRSVKLGVDNAPSLALTPQSQDSFGGFFQALGEFFRNLFSVGGRDASRISKATRAGNVAAKAKREELNVREEARALSEARLTRLKNLFSKADTSEDRTRIQAEIDKLRPSLRSKRAEVRQARKAAFEESFDASSPGKKGKAESAPSAGFPVTGDPILKRGMKDEGAGGKVPQHQIEVLQQFLNATESAGLVIDGKYGKNTYDAVVSFQKKNGLRVDGKVGPDTAAVIAAKASSAE